MFPREHEINVFSVYKTETRAYVKRWDCALYTLLIITKPLVSTYRFRLSANHLCQVISFLSTLNGYVFAQKLLNRAKLANE